MRIDVKWLIEESGLQDLRCLAGAIALNDEITSVNVLDNIDPANWMQKGELVLTTGYCFKDSIELQRQIVHNLKIAGCAALGIKVNRFFDQIPGHMLEAADEVGLTIIEIPYYYRFSEISRLVFDSLHSEEFRVAEASVRLQQELLNCYASGGGIDKMLDIIREATGDAVIISDRRHKVLSYSLPIELMCGPQPEIVIIDNPDNSDFVDIVINGEKTRFGVLHLHGSPAHLLFNSESCLADAICRSASVIALAAEAHIEPHNHSYFGMFVDLLEGGCRSDEEIRLICDMYGFNYNKKRICITVRVDASLAEANPRIVNDVSELMSSILSENHHGHFMCINNCLISTFVYFDRSLKNILAVMECRSVANEIRDSLYKRFSREVKGYKNPFLIGIGRCHIRLVTIPESFRDSLQAIHLIETLNEESKISSYFEQIPYHVLSALDNDELAKIYRDSIKILADYDKSNGTELVTTLLAYFRCRFNAAETAKRLFLHRNTLAARLEKIRGLLHMDLDNLSELFSLYLGICAMQLLKDSLPQNLTASH